MAFGKAIREFIQQETAAANLLIIAMVLALIVSNSPWGALYDAFFHTALTLSFGDFHVSMNPHFIINDGLMSIFFLVVGLEIKYELCQGSLNTRAKAFLPGFAAIGGMLVPALIYIAFNLKDPDALRGWAIPTATDIAFALGVLSLLRHRAPIQLKAFLTALAIFDDLAAIIIIALFYTSTLSLSHLGLAFMTVLTLALLNLKNVNNVVIYCLLGGLLWACFLNAGVHPTLAGVVLAFLMPLNHPRDDIAASSKLKHWLHPFVAFFIMPLFAFANAGVSFIHLSPSSINLSIALGIFASLFFGKQIGVFGAAWLAVKLRLAARPDNVSWIQLYGVSLICGIGFTISLFIGALAFDSANLALIDSVKIGVLSGSLLSGLTGYWILARLKSST